MTQENSFQFFIEIPVGSSVKYEVDNETGELVADRFLYGASVFPANYGYIKGTKAGDGDPADIVVLASQPLVPGCVVKGNIIGMLEMEDEEGTDHKFIGVPLQKVDPVYGAWADIDDIPEATKNRITHFFETYKTLEPGKWVKLRLWVHRKEALAEVAKWITS